jgi:hypothetical protein
VLVFNSYVFFLPCRQLVCRALNWFNFVIILKVGVHKVDHLGDRRGENNVNMDHEGMWCENGDWICVAQYTEALFYALVVFVKKWA